ncbi:dennd1a [Symbiodinium sp. CCMP2592]|nr:dennd1a [Symbiodinium sp. CCMP2592]
MGVLYWGGGLEGQGWDLSGRLPGGFPRIDRYSDALLDSWKGRMENAQVTLRMCASEGPGFKRYMKHFMMLSSQACVEFRLRQYHRYNTLCRRKVLTERQVIGGILETWHKGTPNSGMRISNGGPGEPGFLAFLNRRARRYRAQARRLGGHFAAVILEGGHPELKFVAAAKTLSAERPANLKRVLLILGGPDGISDTIRQQLRTTLEEHTDFPVLGIALPGGILHSYYALATVFVFHDQGLLIPYLEFQVGKPREVVKSKARPPARPETPESPAEAPAEAPSQETTEAPPKPRDEAQNKDKTERPEVAPKGPLPPGPVNALWAFAPKPPPCPPPAHLLAQRPQQPAGAGAQRPESTVNGGLLPKVPGLGPSEGMSALCAFGEILVGLIWPLRPAAVYVPLLPDALVDFCGAPLPFVLGISSEMVQRAEAICEPQTMFVDIDSGEIRVVQENSMSAMLGFCSTRPGEHRLVGPKSRPAAPDRPHKKLLRRLDLALRGIDFEAFLVALLFVVIGEDEDGVLVEPVILAASFTQANVV